MVPRCWHVQVALHDLWYTGTGGLALESRTEFDISNFQTGYKYLTAFIRQTDRPSNTRVMHSIPILGPGHFRVTYVNLLRPHRI